MKKKKYGFGTKTVHGGEGGKFMYHPASTPIYQTSTFFFDNTGEAGDVYRGGKEGFIYTRIGNPTVKAFEEKMALLEGGEAAVAFSSGMGAISAVFLELLKPGDEMISSRRIYGGSKAFLKNILGRLNCKVNYFEPYENLERKLPQLINKKTRFIFFETPSNPELSIVDIRLISKIAAEYGLMSVIDNTFATPYLQKPLNLGVDCVVHSATKYIGGHGDSIGGAVVSSKDFVSRLRKSMLPDLGACLSPFNAWLFLRGLKSLHVRMDYHCRSASLIAGFLNSRAEVKEVLFPGLRAHPGHEIARSQMTGFGGMVSFRLSDRRACRRFMDKLRLCKIGVSLGDTETIVLHSASLQHARLSDSACRKIGVDPTLIRLSTGLEDAEDIIEDIGDALNGI